jgi:hypothetical protein
VSALRLLGFFTAGTLAVFSSTEFAHAQGNYANSPLGGRAALLGGTGVVLGTDGAAPFLNPATMLRIESGSLAFSARFFRYSELTLESWHQPGAVDAGRFGALDLRSETVKDRNLESLPDTTCFFFDAPGSKRGTGRAVRTRLLAICTGKTEEEDTGFANLNFSAASAGQLVNQTQSLDQEWSHRSFGPSAAFALSDRLWLGASLFLTRAKLRNTVSVSTITEQTAGAALSSSYFSSASGDSWDVLLQLGLSLQLSDVVTAGVGLRTPNVHVLDNFHASQVSSFDDGTPQTRYWAGDGSFVVRQPPRLALGVAFEWERLRLEFDAFLHAGQGDYARAEFDRELVVVDDAVVTSRTASPVALTEAVNPLLNVGVGAEWFVAKTVSLLFGVGSDLNALPDRENGLVDGTLFRSRMNWVRFGSGMASYTEYGDLVLGVRGDYGRGEIQAVNAFVEPNRLELVDQREFGVMLVLAGRISLGTLQRAALGVQNVVEGEAPAPGKQPPQPTRDPPLQQR